MRTKKQRKTDSSRLFAITALALLAPALISLARQNPSLLQTAGTRAAIASAAINMPDGGLELIKDRFRSELYYEDDVKPAPTPGENSDHPQIENHNPGPQIEPESPEPIPEADGAKSAKPPKIPDEYAAGIVNENFAGRPGGTLIQSGLSFIKNETKKSDAAIESLLEEDYDLSLQDTGDPQVLLFHTHATESFERYDSDTYDTRNTWRSTDNNNNMAAVGSAMQEILESEGIGVLHDTTQHDYPSYNGSYERSAVTIKNYLDEYPSVKIVFDLHRDAMQRDNQSIVKPVTVISGKKAAQIMIIVGCDDGTMNMPDWPKNLRFAVALQNKIEEMYPGLMRPIYLCYRKYNMDLSPGSLLLEFGSNANTLDEASYSAQLAGKALAELIKESEN